MVIGRKETGALALLAVAGVLLWRAVSPAGNAAERTAVRLDLGADIPAIDLARLNRASTPASPSTRDLFRFGREARVDVAPLPTPVIRLAPTPAPLPPTPTPEPTPTPWPQLNISLIGIVDNGAGRKIASFVKDGEIVLVGQPGQILGNAFRVIRIGTESAEVEELGSGRTRRLPLKTN